MKLEESIKDLQEGKSNDFDKAYNTWHAATYKLTKAFKKAATNKKGVILFEKGLQTVEDGIDLGIGWTN